MSIEVSNLCKDYGTQRAVNDISFQVKRGEIVGFLGPNGAGKSTTLKILTGYLQPTAGHTKVCGLALATDAVSVRKKIGYLAEQNALYPDLYVREYLSFIASVHQISTVAAAVEQALSLTKLESEAHKTIGQLSKGYKQRVGLAAALIHNPEVLILDEPTSGLDPNQLAEIRSLIKQQGQTKTVLFSTHILQEVEAICDRVIIINKGTIVADSLLPKLAETVSLPRRDMKLEEIFRYLTGES
ncbi:ATP-binding cassette domain-containing protein [Candidatus Dependentiae bacterium]|nr:ATP-binding cassette domain-containing protein [Candidatus Dependentiae bacterium]